MIQQTQYFKLHLQWIVLFAFAYHVIFVYTTIHSMYMCMYTVIFLNSNLYHSENNLLYIIIM